MLALCTSLCHLQLCNSQPNYNICQHNSNGGGHSGIFPSTKLSALKACISSSLQLNDTGAAAVIVVAAAVPVEGVPDCTDLDPCRRNKGAFKKKIYRTSYQVP